MTTDTQGSQFGRIREPSGDTFGLGEGDEDELCAALGWLLECQPAIERVLAKRHLSGIM
jgi:hypothetical protein